MKTPFSFTRRFAGWMFACAAVAGSALAQTAPQQNYVAIVTSNVNVGGISMKKGYQYRAISYDRVEGTVTVSDGSKAFKIPFNSVRVVPQDQAGITVVRAEYGSSGQRAKNVTDSLQRKLDGQQKVSFVVSGADLGVRTQQSQQMPSGAGQGPAAGGGSGGMQTPMAGGASGNSAMMEGQSSATLTIEFFYNGSPQTVSVQEGKTLSIPPQ